MNTEEPTRALVTQGGGLQPAKTRELTLGETREYAQVFVASGLFKDVKSLAQAQVKIMMGQELGIGPFASMNMIEIVEGKAELKPSGMRAVILRDGKYDYVVKELTDDRCVIEFYRLGTPHDPTGPRALLGVSLFTQADAAKAGLGGTNSAYNMYKKYPRNMLISRATSNGVKWFCPDVFMGDVYYQGELREEREGEAVEVAERSEAVQLAFEEVAFYMSEDNKQAFTAMYYDTEASEEQIFAFLYSFKPNKGEASDDGRTAEE